MKPATILKAAAVAVAISACGMAGASIINPVPETGTGIWMENFAQATNLAYQTKTPMLLFWSSKGCDHCEALQESVAGSAAFAEWMNESYMVYCFTEGEYSAKAGGVDDVGVNAGSGAKNFAKTANGTLSKKESLTLYPMICLYWPKPDGTVMVTSFTGRSGQMGSGATLADKLMNKAKSFFADYEPKPDYLGGELDFTADYPQARLEAIKGQTAKVTITISRKGAATNFATQNRVVAKIAGTEVQSTTVTWAKKEMSKAVDIAIPGTAAIGDTIEVALKGADEEDRSSVNIHVVGEVENSPKNPLFIGERTADTLKYGEWTMDLDVALEKYAGEPSSKLLALVGGSLWCPDCVMGDLWLLDRSEFKDWAIANNVILVDIDIPNLPNTVDSPSLLTKIVSRASDNYVTARGTMPTNENWRWQSGALYLSRHGVSDAAAAAVAARNRQLVGTNRLNGGWNDPERANQNRTGVPVFFTLTRDGEVAGCLDTFSSVAPKEFKSEYLDRFNELLAFADDTTDIDNSSWQTTTETYNGTGGKSATLSPVDLADTYKLAATTDPAALQTVRVSGSDSSVTATLSLIGVVNGTAKTIATATGVLSSGLEVEGVISSSGVYYVKVSAPGQGTLAIDSGAGSSVNYSLSGAREAIKNPFTNDFTTLATSTTLPLFDSEGELAGTLALTMKKTRAISAKYNNGKKNLATLSGKWNSDIAADGTATAVLSKKGCTLYLEMSQTGVIQAFLSDGSTTLSSGECGIAEAYSEFTGVYNVALPVGGSDCSVSTPHGSAYMTLTMAGTMTAQKRGTVKYTVYLPDGKKLSGTTNITWLDANFGIVPILKEMSVERFSAAVKVRKNAASAPSSRAVVAMDGTSASWVNRSIKNACSLRFGVNGSYYLKTRSVLFGVDDETLSLAFSARTENLADSEQFGALNSVLGNGATILVTDKTITAVDSIKGFKFKFNRNTGIISGTTKINFEGKQNVAGKFGGILFPGWFSECACGEDDDPLIGMENVAFALGCCTFTDKISGRRATRSFPIEIGTLD